VGSPATIAITGFRDEDLKQPVSSGYLCAGWRRIYAPEIDKTL
jgi:hypothetical protein